eukprot:TRINITY_DN9103_c0_g1_i3.p1 TRINITY_DN9103_c0_g1~~TRINITY_DN9103_c0_g1_i3.p1  ORF type:complete len:163 (-),score=17.92 TRINITY_DN9103_c0_g1_i3:286-774(-)
MIRRPPRSTLSSSSAASDVYKRQGINAEYGEPRQGDMTITREPRSGERPRAGQQSTQETQETYPTKQHSHDQTVHLEPCVDDTAQYGASRGVIPGSKAEALLLFRTSRKRRGSPTVLQQLSKGPWGEGMVRGGINPAMLGINPCMIPPPASSCTQMSSSGPS